MEIVVRLRFEVAHRLHHAVGDATGAAELNAVLNRFGVELKPQHPGASDPALQSYFTISGVSSDQAEHIVSALRELEAVEAAYVQPPVSPA